MWKNNFIGPRIKNTLTLLGMACGFLGLFFVGLTFLKELRNIGMGQFLLFLKSYFGLLGFIYFFSSLLLALAWLELLVYLGGGVVRYRIALPVYGLSQLAKYLPGNIFHLAGRQALGVAKGIPGKALAQSILGELIVIAFAGSFFIFLLLPVMFPQLPALFGGFSFLAAFSVAVLILTRFFDIRVARCFCLQTIFLFLSGCIFVVCLVFGGSEVSFSRVIFMIGAYVIAWVAGLITPGAPAGLGIREMVLLFFLHAHVEQSVLVFATILARMVSIAGDVLFYVVALLWSAYSAKNKVG